MLQLINPLQLSSIWNTIKPGIEEIIRNFNKDCQQEFWTPEDVYHELKANTAVLFLSTDGFVVARVEQDRYTGIKKFYVWLGYSFDPKKDVLEESQEFLENIAKYYGCELISFSSNRLGWLRKAKNIGYTLGTITFIKRL